MSNTPLSKERCDLPRQTSFLDLPGAYPPPTNSPPSSPSPACPSPLSSPKEGKGSRVAGDGVPPPDAMKPLGFKPKSIPKSGLPWFHPPPSLKALGWEAWQPDTMNPWKGSFLAWPEHQCPKCKSVNDIPNSLFEKVSK